MLYLTYLRRNVLGFLIILFNNLSSYSQNYIFENSTHFYPIIGDTSQFTIDSPFLRLNGNSSPTSIFFPKEIGIEGNYSLSGAYISEPSSSNHIKWYLYTNQKDNFNEGVSLYLKLGGSSGTNDKLELYASNNNVSTKIWVSTIGLNSLLLDLKIKIQNDSVFCVFNNQKDSSAISLPTYLENIQSNAYMAFSCIYTSTKKNLFSCSNISYLQNIKKPTDLNPIEIYPGIIRITEVMSDPSPSRGLPEVEYIEIYNTSNHSISLNNWTIQDNSLTHYLLPNTIIAPYVALILTSKTGCEIIKNNQCLALASFPTLNNDTDYLVLKNKDQLIIDSVFYKTNLNDYQSDGGYSYIPINTKISCQYGGELKYTDNTQGGTLFEVEDTPFTFNYHILQTPSLSLQTNLFGNIKFVESELQYNNLKNIPIPFSIEDGTVREVSLEYQPNCPNFDTTFNLSIFIKKPSSPIKQELLFNEVLFNPLPYFQEYIELYNNSAKLLSLSNISLRYEDHLGIKEISFSPIELPANSYILLTKDTTRISQYKPNTVCLSLILSALPSLNDDAFTLTLLSGDTILDYVTLNKELHNPLLTSVEGIALEKTSLTDFSNMALWTSSTEMGTPWKRNSILLTEFQQSNSIDCQPTHLFQNKAGHPTFMQITIKNNQMGSYFNAGIYTLEGQEVKSFARSAPSKAENTFLWHGENNESTPIQTGIYILLIETWNSDGSVSILKKLISTSD